MWYVFELKERYGKENQRREFFERLKSHYKKSSKDIYISLNNRNIGLNYYVFIRDENIENLWKELKNDKYINEYFEYQPISEKEMDEMVAGVEFIRDDISFGDVVKISGGKFNKLNGIVLRDKGSNEYLIGLKFCFGVCFVVKPANELEIVGNIFNYIKVKK